MKTTVIHATCGQPAEKDDFDFLDDYHRLGHCRGSAHHPVTSWPKSPRNGGRKGTF